MEYNNLFTLFETVQAPPIVTEKVKKARQQYRDLMNDTLDIYSIIPGGINPEDWARNTLEFQEQFSDDRAQAPDFLRDNLNESNDSSTVAQRAIDFAKQFIGSKYTWGGSNPNTGFDCSGLGYYSFAQFGVKLPRTASEMAKVGIEVPIDQVQKGDFIVTKSSGPSGHHIVWVTGRDENGNIKVIEARDRKQGVIESTFSNFKNIKAVRRITDSAMQDQFFRIKNTPPFGSRENYVKSMYRYLYSALQKQGLDGAIWAPILVAQTAVESGWGNEFSRRNNNYAGIKGKGNEKVSTKEYVPGRGYIATRSNFKSYPTITAFADDFVSKLKNKFKAFNGGPSQYLFNIKTHNYFTASLSDYSKAFNSALKEVQKILS